MGRGLSLVSTLVWTLLNGEAGPVTGLLQGADHPLQEGVQTPPTGSCRDGATAHPVGFSLAES